MGRPIALHSEKRPPTQSQNPNMLAVSMPKSRTAAALVDTATKWRATAASSPSAPTSQARAAWALASVSWVVKVFEATTEQGACADRSGA